MNRWNLSLGLLALAAMLIAGCAAPSPEPEKTQIPASQAGQSGPVSDDGRQNGMETQPAVQPASTLPATIRDHRAALQAALDHITRTQALELPAEWRGEKLDAEAMVGAVVVRFSAGDWTATVSGPVARLNLSGYTLVIEDAASGFTWLGTVDEQGRVLEQPAEP